jgi:preprotein translocase subunit SecD
MNTELPGTSEKDSGLLRVVTVALVILLGAALAYFIYYGQVHPEAKFPFKYGLDLAGGSQLVYEADTSNVSEEEVEELMSVLKEVIERRINIFGVSEPIIQVEKSSIVSGEIRHRLVVELPGVTDVDEAVKEIGRTPLLEFKLLEPSATVDPETGAVDVSLGGDGDYVDTGLTGRYLERAELVFGQGSGGLSNQPIVSLQFTEEGGQLFEQITTDHTGEFLAIFLDGEMVSMPRINEPIAGGSAIIEGNFTAEEGRDLVQNLNFGALPLPIELASTQTIDASLGIEILEKGVIAGAIGLGFVMLFMLLWYRLPGFIAVVALAEYLIIMLALFKLIPVTLTAAGLAGLVLSVGMAVDANILVFERMKEELRKGSDSREAARQGFKRAWTSIRDGNVTSIFAAIILFWLGTSIVKGFALVFGIGVVVSMVSALLITRALLLALPAVKLGDGSLLAKLLGNGFSK